MITKSQYLDWKNSEVTQAMYEDVKEVVEDVGNQLISRRTSDPIDDSWLRGYVRGVQAGREWVPEFVEDENGQD